jgi:uncharacterized protein (DUF433 family)
VGAELPGGLIARLDANRSRPGPQRSEILGGTPVFIGTRVPVQNLIDHLDAGDSIDDFLRSFPSVDRKLVIAYLDLR